MLTNFFEYSFSLALTPDVPDRSACSCIPLPHHTSLIGSEAHAFVTGLARAGKVLKKIKIIIYPTYGVKTLQQAQIYRIMKLLKDRKEVNDERGHGKTNRIRDAALIALFAATVEEDRWVTVQEPLVCQMIHVKW